MNLFNNMELIKKENQPIESCIEESQKSHRCTVQSNLEITKWQNYFSKDTQIVLITVPCELAT